MRARSHRGILAAAAVALLAGCIREDLPSCATVHQLYVRVVPPSADGSPESPADGVDTATLFVFDNGEVLRQLIGIDSGALAREEPVELSYCGSCRPRVVAWGNLTDTPVPVPVLGVTSLGDLRLTTRSDGEYARVPDNLYYGIRDLTCERVQCIWIGPAMGRLTVTARGLARESGERYFFRVETHVDGYDFLRTPLPGREVFRLDASRRESSGDLTSGQAVPLFAYPEDDDFLKPLTVSLYRLRDDGAHLVGQTDLDDKALEIVPRAGRCVNVMMDFRTAAGVRVDIRITEWDVIELWENW